MIVLIVSLSLVSSLIVAIAVLFALYWTTVEKSFRHHNESKKFPYSLTYEAYRDELCRARVEIKDVEKETLVGYYYRGKESSKPQALVVISHGFNSDHTKYMPEIATFAKSGYLVFAYDNTANGESEGDDQYSLYHSSLDARRVLDHLAPSNTLPLILYGHSWGAFAVLSAVSKEDRVKAVIARSGFEQESQTIVDALQRDHRLFAYLLRPWARLFSFLSGGKKTNIRASKGVLSAPDTRFLILHARDDELVFYRHSAARALIKAQKKGKGPQVKVRVYPEGGHLLLFKQPTKALRAAARKEYNHLLSRYGTNIPDDILSDYKKRYPLKKLYEINGEVMSEITTFMAESLSENDS